MGSPKVGMSLDAGQTQRRPHGQDRGRQGASHAGLEDCGHHEHHSPCILAAALQAHGRTALSGPLGVGLGGQFWPMVCDWK